MAQLELPAAPVDAAVECPMCGGEFRIAEATARQLPRARLVEGAAAIVAADSPTSTVDPSSFRVAIDESVAPLQTTPRQRRRPAVL
jgi:hypothetical protein